MSTVQSIMPTQNLLKAEEFKHLPYWEATIEPSDMQIGDTDFLNMTSAILNGKEYRFLKEGNSVTDKNEMDEGALSFGSLKECGCSVLGRRENNRFRHMYEDLVITEIERLSNNQTIRIAAFATGLLFGEYVLLTKIVQKLSEKNSRIQKVVFDCIDTAYESFWDQCKDVQQRVPGAVSWNKDLKAAIPEFITLIQKIVAFYKAKFLIELRFFPQKNCLFQHQLENGTIYHLLIGADRGPTEDAVKVLNCVLKCFSIFLERRSDGMSSDKAYIQKISSRGESILIPLS